MSQTDLILLEVGPRDGLQNETNFVPTKHKIEFINLLSQTGLQHIEATSFVSPKAIPQLADSELVFRDIQNHRIFIFPHSFPMKTACNKLCKLA